MDLTGSKKLTLHKESQLKRIIFYLLIVLLVDLLAMAYSFLAEMPFWWQKLELLVGCVLVGGVGGVLYCLRAVYISACIRKEWDDIWQPWYYIRPIVSHLCGGVSFLFLKAGLLVLESQKTGETTNIGFYALAFIAGMNVDKFIAKIEDIAKTTWGIDKSRISGNK